MASSGPLAGQAAAERNGLVVGLYPVPARVTEVDSLLRECMKSLRYGAMLGQGRNGGLEGAADGAWSAFGWLLMWLGWLLMLA